MRQAAILLAFLALAGCAGAKPDVRLQPYAFQPGHIDLARGPDGNTVILDAPEGLIVVDTGRHPDHAARIAQFAQGTGKPVAAIVNTHWHLDHTTGNRDLKLAWPGAQVIATDAAKGARTGFLAAGIESTRAMAADETVSQDQRDAAARRLAAVTDDTSFLPDKTIARDYRTKVAGRTIEFHVEKAAVTAADLWLVVPDERLAVVGDLVVAQAPFYDTGCEEGWGAGLAAIWRADWDTLIPGHGAPMNRTDFERWRTAYHAFVDCSHSGSPAQTCANGWLEDARGFYAAEEAEQVRQLAIYYFGILNAPPEKRMPYCVASRP